MSFNLYLQIAGTNTDESKGHGVNKAREVDWQ